MVDFGKTAADYGKHRQGFPEELFRRLRAFNIGLPGQRVVDLGTGTGTVARSLALAGCRLTGIDPAAPMLEQARALDAAAGVSIDYIAGRAENTGLPAASFDLVTAGQCWRWFDRVAAAREVMRLLVPGGALAILTFDWIPLPGNVVAATEALIEKHNPSWLFGGAYGIHGQWTIDTGTAGFVAHESFSFDLPAWYTHEAWRGRIRASAGVGASLPPEAVAAFDAEHAAMLARDFPEDPIAVPHRTWALVCRKPA